jgi:hypothetical protein
MQANKSRTWALKSQRRQAQRAQLVADGRKALELVRTRPIADVLLIIGGSRARLYRAMKLIEPETDKRDPLLL